MHPQQIAAIYTTDTDPAEVDFERLAADHGLQPTPEVLDLIETALLVGEGLVERALGVEPSL